MKINITPSRLKRVLLYLFLLLFFLVFVNKRDPILKYERDGTNYIEILNIEVQAKKNDEDDICLSPNNISRLQLNSILKVWFTMPTLNYNQFNNGKKLPQNEYVEAVCFKNLRVYINSFSGININLTYYAYYNKRIFLEEYANPKIEACKEKRCVIKPYLKEEKRPDPLILIKNNEKTINVFKINDELNKLSVFGKENGDDDLLEIPEVVKILENKSFKVPNIVHFVSFSCHEYKISAYLTMLSALKHQSPDLILLHTDCEPTGWYWELFKTAAGNMLKIVRKTPPKSIFGNPIKVVEHQADIARLHILLQIGGIYLDSDTLVMKSLDELRKYNIVLGEESLISLANGAVLTNKDSWFLKRWFQEYENFDDGHWGISSVETPRALWQLFPEEIHVVEVFMMRPNWREYQMLHRGFFDWSNHYTVHLTTRYMDKFDKHRTLTQFAVLNTSYGEVARKILWGDSSLRDVQTEELLNPHNW